MYSYQVSSSYHFSKGVSISILHKKLYVAQCAMYIAHPTYARCNLNRQIQQEAQVILKMRLAGSTELHYE